MPTVISAVDFHRRAGDLLARVRYRGEHFRQAARPAGGRSFGNRRISAPGGPGSQATERTRHFAAFESALETAPPPEADLVEPGDDVIQAEVDVVREAHYAPGTH